MCVVRPFKGLRVSPEHAKRVASPPYDVLSASEAREIVRENPDSFLRVNKAELEFGESVNPYSEQVYRRGKDNLARLVNQGLMVRDRKPCFYLYRITMGNHSQLGLVALSPVDEYDRGKIKKHEHTRPEKVNDRADHISYLEAQVGPVFCAFRHDGQADQVLERIATGRAGTDFTAADGVRHELWVVDTDGPIREIIDAFARVPHLYIADGHHRARSASEVRRRAREKNPNHTGEEIYNFFLNVIFPDDQLNILPYNRVVKDLKGLTLEQVLETASEKFDISPCDGQTIPEQPHTFALYCERKWYLMKSREGSFDPDAPAGSIDAAILDRNFIAPVLGITDPKTDKRIRFVGGIRGTEELVRLVDSGKYKIAFSLYPASMEQLLDVADAGEVMPPKSTWFEPKLRSGMVVNLLTE